MHVAVLHVVRVVADGTVVAVIDTVDVIAAAAAAAAAAVEFAVGCLRYQTHLTFASEHTKTPMAQRSKTEIETENVR